MKKKETSTIKRIINLIIDSCAITVSSLLIFYLFSIIYLKLHIHTLNENSEIIRLDLFVLFVFVAYYLFFETFTGKTIGKYITKTKVVNTDLSKPRFIFILLRTIIRLIPFEFLTFLNERNGWHDRFSSTRVINTDD